MAGCARFGLFFVFGWLDMLGLGCNWCLDG